LHRGIPGVVQQTKMISSLESKNDIKTTRKTLCETGRNRLYQLIDILAPELSKTCGDQILHLVSTYLIPDSPVIYPVFDREDDTESLTVDLGWCSSLGTKCQHYLGDDDDDDSVFAIPTNSWNLTEYEVTSYTTDNFIVVQNKSYLVGKNHRNHSENEIIWSCDLTKSKKRKISLT
jgi:hypothetical protein